MSTKENEKFDGHDSPRSKEEPPYTVQQEGEIDVEEGEPRPLKRALESRHMQMIAIVSPISIVLVLQANPQKKEQAVLHKNHLLGRCHWCWSVRWFRRSARRRRSRRPRHLLYHCRRLDAVHYDVPW